jgi:hypothetical protein
MDLCSSTPSGTCVVGPHNPLKPRPYPAPQHTARPSCRGQLVSGTLVPLFTVADGLMHRTFTYLGLVTLPDGTRSHWTKVFRPGSDSARSELRLALVLSLGFIAFFAAGLVTTQNWLWRIGVGAVVLLIYIPLFVRSIWYLRRQHT